MAKTGKTSAAALAVVHNVAPIQKIEPPETLDAEHLAEWLTIVNAKPTNFFGKEHAAMLEALCRHIVNAKKIARLLDALVIHPGMTDQELRQLERLQKLHHTQTSAQDRLMRSMRLTHQSIYRADKAPRVVGGAADKPWMKQA